MNHNEFFKTIFGEKLRVVWTGSVYQDPSTGAQSSDRDDIMHGVLREFMRAGGDDIEEGESIHAYGEWEN